MSGDGGWPDYEKPCPKCGCEFVYEGTRYGCVPGLSFSKFRCEGCGEPTSKMHVAKGETLAEAKAKDKAQLDKMLDHPLYEHMSAPADQPFTYPGVGYYADTLAIFGPKLPRALGGCPSCGDTERFGVMAYGAKPIAGAGSTVYAKCIACGFTAEGDGPGALEFMRRIVRAMELEVAADEWRARVEATDPQRN